MAFLPYCSQCLAIQIIRSVLPLLSFAMEKTLYNDPKYVSSSLVFSMLLVIVGTTLYGYSSASVTGEALMWIFVNSVFTVVATVFRSKFMKDKNFSVSTPLCMCSVSTTAIPFICVSAALTGEVHQWPAVIANTSATAWFWATMSGLVAGCFSFLQFRCQKKLSGTSDLMFQNAVKVFIIIMGMVAFGDSFSFESFCACALALGGCAWYGTLRKAEVSGSAKAGKSELKEPLMRTDEISVQTTEWSRFKVGLVDCWYSLTGATQQSTEVQKSSGKKVDVQDLTACDLEAKLQSSERRADKA